LVGVPTERIGMRRAGGGTGNDGTGGADDGGVWARSPGARARTMHIDRKELRFIN